MNFIVGLLSSAKLGSSLLPTVSISAPSHEGRIIGGRLADIKHYPYQASFEYFGSIMCGAAIISEEWVISAAHCIEDAEMDRLTFRVGSSIKGEGGTLHEVVQMLQHPKFDYDAHNFDVAIMKVATPFIFRDSVQAIPLATKEPVAGQIATVTGWGTTGPDQSYSPRLQVVDFPVIDHEQCVQDYLNMAKLTENMICAGYASGGNDTCRGDSGGPLVVDGKLAGIVSFGAGCAVPGYPGVYTNVAAVLDFIVDNTGIKV